MFTSSEVPSKKRVIKSVFYFCQETVSNERVSKLGRGTQEVYSTSLNRTAIPKRTEQLNYAKRIGKIDAERWVGNALSEFVSHRHLK